MGKKTKQVEIGERRDSSASQFVVALTPYGYSTTSRTATKWCTDPFLVEDFDQNEHTFGDWTREKTDDANLIPYYVNHEKKKTQWIDPRLETWLHALTRHDEIKLCVYRTAAKFRDLQVFFNMGAVHISYVADAFYSIAFTEDGGHKAELSVHDLEGVIHELYLRIENSKAREDVLCSFLLETFDRHRTGRIFTVTAKIALALFSFGWVEEKYRYIFGILDADSDGFISREELSVFLQIAVQILDTLREAFPFCPSREALIEYADACLSCSKQAEGSKQQEISLDTFLEWCMSEPRPLVWIPTYHRLAATENMKHETYCDCCKQYPIIGMRYKNIDCLNVDVCQECYWKGLSGKKHRPHHQVLEYCFPTSPGRDSKDFRRRLGRKCKKLFSRKKKREHTELTAPPFEPPKIEVTDARNGTDADALAVQTLQGDNKADPMDLEGVARAGAMSTVVVSLDTQQKMHLLRVIDELDAENRDLVRQLNKLQVEVTSGQNQAATAMDASLQEGLRSHIDQLNAKNKELMDIIRKNNDRRAMAQPDIEFDSFAMDADLPDLDLSELDLSEDEANDDQQIFADLAAIDTAFNDLAGPNRQQILQSQQNPHLGHAVGFAEQIGNGLVHAVMSIQDSLGRRGSSTSLGGQQQGKPRISRLSQTDRMSLYGRSSVFSADEDDYDESDSESQSDRDSVAFHSRVLRRSRKKLKAKLKRLSHHHQGSEYVSHGETPSLLADTNGAAHKPTPPPLISSHAFGTSTIIEQPGESVVDGDDSAQQGEIVVGQGSGALHFGGVSSQPKVSAMRTTEGALAPSEGDGFRGGTGQDLERLREKKRQQEEQLREQEEMLRKLREGSFDDVSGSHAADDDDVSLSSASTTQPELPSTLPPGEQSYSTTMGDQSSSTVLSTPVRHGSGSRVLRLSGDEAQGELFSSPRFVGRTGSRGDTLASLGTPKHTPTKIKVDEDSEVGAAHSRVNPRHGGRHNRSLQRRQIALNIFRRRLEQLAVATEDVTGTPLQGFDEGDPEHTAVQAFADGSVACLLAKKMLEQKGLPSEDIVFAESDGETPLSEFQTIANFNKLSVAAERLGIHPSQVPQHLIFRELPRELHVPPKDRVYHKKVLAFLERLLNIKPPSSNPNTPKGS